MSRPLRPRAPADNGAILALPPLAEVEQLIHHNRKTLERENVRILDRPLPELRRQARTQAIIAARAYLEQAGQLVRDGGSEVLILAGHQPELFHPGVWAKNFALAGLSRRFQATSINLIVDNHVAKSTLLRLPAREIPEDMGLLDSERDIPRLVRVPYDAWGGDVPYEERRVLDEALFASLPERAAPWIGDWKFLPFLPAFWAEVRKHSATSVLLGERLVRARRVFEQQWGCCNLEVPTSSLCRTESFTRFACHILTKLPDFHESFNGAIRDYRRLHGIRSRHHPMPELVQDGDWLEAPFWAWQTGTGRRRRLFVRSLGDALSLRAGNAAWPTLKSSRLVNEFQDLERSGYRIRTRAVTTTLFARLLLADAFIHGLGGGLYDAVTDQVMRDFFGIEPPRFAILTGTLRLPFPEASNASDDCNRLKREIRDLTCNPQRHLDGDARAKALVEAKEDWIDASVATRAERRKRYQALRELNRQLRGFLVSAVIERTKKLAHCQREVLCKELLERRDFSFCLHPEPSLRDFLVRNMEI